MRQFNILYLANSGCIVGGGEISLLALIEGLDREKFRPIAVCPSNGRLTDALREIGIDVKIVRMDTLRNLNVFSWLRSVNKLRQLIRSEDIDLIHSNGSRAAIYGGIAGRLTRIPLIWHVRIADHDRLLDRVLAVLATKIIAISKAVARRFEWLKDKEKVSIVYNGVDLGKFNPAVDGNGIREEFRFSKEAPLVGTVGRLDRYKAHRYFLYAAKKVAAAVSGARFLIVGDGEYKRELEALKDELGLNEVVFTGNREDIPQILASLDLFVLSSVSEGFGRSAAEAMACGKAVVATDVGGLPEVVEAGVTGKLVRPKDTDSLAEAIIALLRDEKEAERMGGAGRKRAEKLFGMEENIRQTQSVYEEVLKG